MNTLVVISNLLLILWISVKSLTHFDRGKREPNGMRLIRLLTPIGVFANIYHHFTDPKHISNLTLALAGFFILVSSIVFFYALQASKSTRLPVAYSFDSQKQLVTDGIYSRIRHPFYTSYIMYWLSWLSLSPGFLFGYLFDIFLIGIYLVAIAREEIFLARAYGTIYKNYKKNTSMIIPYIF